MGVSRKLATICAGALVAGACAAVPAFADSGVPTSFGFSQVNQDSFDYTDPTITLTGTLWDVGVTPNTAIADEPVTVTEQVAGTGPVKDVGSATTDANGNFTVTLTDQPAGGIFEAVFAGDTSDGNDYAATTSSAVQVIPDYSPVNVSYTATPRSPVTSGTRVTFSGQVYVPADDAGSPTSNTPIVGANVYVFTGGEYTSASPHVATGKDGTFSVSVQPAMTAYYEVEAVANEPWPYCLYTYETGAVGTTITVRNPRRTRIEEFKVPAKHEIHAAFGVSGTVQELSGKKWRAAASATVALYFRSLPHGKWARAAAVRTSSRGAFAWKSQIARLGKFAWQARAEQTIVGSTEYKPSASAARDSFFVDRTYVTHFVAVHLNGDTSLAAIIQDYPASGGVHYANVVGVAKFYYEPSGSTTWRYLGESRATRSDRGSVAIEPGGTLDGKFRIVFPAQGDFLGSSATQSLS
jgi:hypothetical protein